MSPVKGEALSASDDATPRAVELREAPVDANETYLSVPAACKTFGIGRTTFYRMRADRRLGLSEILVRIPPGTGRIKVPRLAFEEWLRQQRRARSPRSGERGAES